MSPTQVDSIAGRYELTGEVLASGGMGRVLAGRDRVLDRPVAIKMLHGGIGLAPGARKRFRAEAVNAARLSHPNVVAVFDAGEHQGRAYIVMERLPGRTLSDELSQGSIGPQRTLEVFTQVLSALQAAHEAGIVHRDVKPGNILIAEDGSARLSDFGIAKLLEQDATMTRELLGTPAYVAPELLEGHRASPTSDLYAVGVVLFEALAGRKPFAGDPSVAHLAALKAGGLPPIRDVAPWVSPRLAAVVDRATRRNPSERFGSAAEMSDALRIACTGAEITMPLPTVPEAAPTIALERLDDGIAGERQLPRRALAAAALVIGVSGIVAAIVSTAGSGSAPGGAPGTSAPRPTTAPVTRPLPGPVESALVELERAVRP